MNSDDKRRPDIKRRIALGGGTALITAAGVGGYLALSGGPASVRLTAAPAVAAPSAASPAAAPDADNVQDTTSVDTGTAAAGAEAPSTEVDAPGGNADPAGSSGQDGNFDN